GAFRASTRDDHAGDAMEEKRFVADVKGRMVRADLQGSRFPPAIAPRKKSRRLAGACQDPGDRDGRGGLSGAADCKVPDADDRKTGALPGPSHAPAADGPVDEAERGQQCARQGGTLTPPEPGSAHQRRVPSLACTMK